MKYPLLLDSVLEANRSPADGAIVFPARIGSNEDCWRDPVFAEFYIDFETVSDLDDDFAAFPEVGGAPMIFMIGCGHYIRNPQSGQPEWHLRTFTARALSPSEELRIIQEWLAYLESECAGLRVTLDRARLFHWSPAEVSFLTEAYNAAKTRHSDPGWPDLPWVDLLNRVVKAEPVTVRGAFGFGLKAIAKAMHEHGLIETDWADGPTDGLGAMVGAWWCHHEAKRLGCAMTDLDLMQEIARYNEVDCRAMAEVLRYLRANR